MTFIDSVNNTYAESALWQAVFYVAEEAAVSKTD